MRNPKLVPYETIVRATSGEPEAIDEVLRHYGKRIRLASLENGQVNKDIVNGGLSLPCSSSALMNSHTPKLNNRRHIERHTKTGNHKKVSCFFAFIFGVFEKPPYCPTKRET